MKTDSDLVSPKQAARVIGCSESTLKRWCDQGLLKTIRTAGGHRKMAVTEVVRFIRERDQQPVSPEVIGLPPVSDHSHLGLTRGGSRLSAALLSGDEALSRQIVFDLYFAKHPLAVIFDDVVATAFREIGELWACHEADVYQERRGCSITSRILLDLRRFQTDPPKEFRAIGGTIEGDLYSLPSIMAEVVLRDCGFDSTFLGNSIPVDSLLNSIVQIRPQVFFLSVSFLREGLEFVNEFARLSRACSESGTALVVGGRALTDDLRQKMSYAAYCDTMQHLNSFATTLQRSLRRGRRKKSRQSP